jgi:deoxyribonuclease V
VDFRRLEELQKAIAKRVELKPLELDKVHYVVGLDVAYSKRFGGVAVAVLVDVKRLKVVDHAIAIGEPSVPYVPGFLAFREAPLLYTAATSLPHSFDVVLVDGHGIAHPRRAGIATHIGVAMAKPSIGVAKRKLVGREVSEAGITYVVHEGRRVAVVLRLASGRRIYVSPGNMVDLESAKRLVEMLTPSGYNYPVPLYQADKMSKDLARKLDRGVVTPAMLKKEVGVGMHDQ